METRKSALPSDSLGCPGRLLPSCCDADEAVKLKTEYVFPFLDELPLENFP